MSDGFNVNPLSAKLNNLNFHPLEVVSRYRDPQLQVGEVFTHVFILIETKHLQILMFKHSFHSQ